MNMKMKMKRSHSIFFLSGLAVSLLLSAAPVRSLLVQDVPHSFVSGSVASADEVNQNFSNLDTRLDALEAAGVGSSPMVLLGRASYSPFINLPPLPVSGATDYLLAQVNVTVPAQGTTIIRLSTNVGSSGTSDYVGTLRVDGVPSPLFTPPFVVPAGAPGAMGLSEREFALELPTGAHNLELLIRNRGFQTTGMIDVFQGTISAFFVAD